MLAPVAVLNTSCQSFTPCEFKLLLPDLWLRKEYTSFVILVQVDVGYWMMSERRTGERLLDRT